MSDEDSIATVRISHIGLFWNRDLVQRYAFPSFSDIFRCFARQEHDCSSAVHPLPHCIIQLTHIQKVVTKEQGLQLQIYSTRGLTPMWPNALSGLYLISTLKWAIWYHRSKAMVSMPSRAYTSFLQCTQRPTVGIHYQVVLMPSRAFNSKFFSKLESHPLAALLRDLMYLFPLKPISFVRL